MSARTVLLVHGAWAGAWAWGYVAAELDARGIAHRAVDLPSRQPGPGNLSEDAAAVRAAIAEIGGEVVLCGHSYAGMVITEAAAGEERVARLVYVCAAMPETGESLGGLMATDPIPSEIGTAIRMADDGTATLDPDAARAIIFSDATDEQVAPVLPALGSHRMGTFGETVAAVGWRNVSSSYAVCAADRVLSEALQQRMAARASEVVTLDAGHAPMLTQPAALADALMRYAADRRAPTAMAPAGATPGAA